MTAMTPIVTRSSTSEYPEAKPPILQSFMVPSRVRDVDDIGFAAV
jgi:hypothetical protein